MMSLAQLRCIIGVLCIHANPNHKSATLTKYLKVTLSVWPTCSSSYTRKVLPPFAFGGASLDRLSMQQKKPQQNYFKNAFILTISASPDPI